MFLDFKLLANPYISSLIPYKPGKPIEEVERNLGITSVIKLASNENPLGSSPKGVSAAVKALGKANIYPDGGCFQLKEKLAKHLNVKRNMLTIGNGSENTLEIIINSFLNNETSAIVSEFAFLTIPILLKRNNVELITVAEKNYRHDVDAIINSIKTNTRMIFIVNPNNPTGTYTTITELKHLLESIPPKILVVVDEAYYEYVNKADYPNTIKLQQQYPNLIIQRTFSKVYGLAALRAGYVISSPTIAEILNKAKLPFNVNAIASAAAKEALDDKVFIEKSINLNIVGLQQLQEGFEFQNIEYIESVGNFITFKVKGKASAIYKKLLQFGIIVRPLDAYNMEDFLRVTVGTCEQNDKFLQALKIILEEV